MPRAGTELVASRSVNGNGPPVVLDAMGGDHAPTAAVLGALAALDRGVDVVLVGNERVLHAELAAAGVPGALAVVHAPEFVDMHEDPAVALRAKPQASIRVAVQALADGPAQALVSAGSTGATVAAALLGLGRLPGVRRPVLGALLPVGRGVVLVDAGASAETQPELLVAAATMGRAYATVLWGGTPRTGLLNVGVERGKGNALVRATYEQLDGLQGFVGNVEPHDVLAGAVDVVLTDGFTGNIFLKTLEAARPGHGSEGAAVLLGVAGTVLVAHGAAGPQAVADALVSARDVAAAGLPMDLGGQLERTARLRGVRR